MPVQNNLSEARLVLPCEDYFEDFRSAEHEFRAEGRRQSTAIDVLTAESNAALKHYRDLASGRNLSAGFVPATDFWLIDGERYIGRVSVRHSLNEMLQQFGGHIGYMIRPSSRRRGYGKLILRLALPMARELGIERVLVTCDETNIGSRRIIEGNGGVFDGERDQGVGLASKLRYWIVTGAQ